MINVTNLRFTYGDRPVFDVLNLHLDGTVCLTGPSGCGKTTLLRLIAGLLTPQSGSITGVPERVAFLFQEDRLLPWCTALENVRAVLPKGKTADAARYLEAVELKEHLYSYPDSLSGGQKRRVALARALAFHAELLLLDEPLTGLDPELAKRMAALTLSSGATIVAAVHSKEEIALLGGSALTLK
jgi:ABC-type nitrate/sulfonate/bicarbonate transport system ATPase subunit